MDLKSGFLVIAIAIAIAIEIDIVNISYVCYIDKSSLKIID